MQEEEIREALNAHWRASAAGGRVGSVDSDALDPVRMRTETDSLGSVQVPADAYWGIHTARALENFPISRRPISRSTRSRIRPST